jgi:ribokinase
MIVVCGSANMDLVIRTPNLPKPGETVLGEALQTFPGGKGANQAVAAAKLGGQVAFLGKLGEDSFGGSLIASMEEAGVVTSHLWQAPGASGVAMILVDDAGQNQIVVSPGANGDLHPADVRRSLDELTDQPNVALAQLEIPMKAVASFFAEALVREVPWRILNPAPAQELPDSVYRSINVIVPNELETETLTGIRLHESGAYAPAVQWFHERGVEHVILTLGEQGALYSHRGKMEPFEAPKVDVVDTTAAGDAFCGALAVGLDEGYEMTECIAFAVGVASKSVTKSGAQASMPYRHEVR